jgi:hypothetical protein
VGANNAANYDITITNASFGQSTVFTLADPGIAAAYIMTTQSPSPVSTNYTLNTPGINFVSSTIGIIGTTTNDSANAGSVGEYVTAEVTAGSGGTALTSTVTSGFVSVSLTAGDWDIWGNAVFITQAATTVTYIFTGICLSTATAFPDGAYQSYFSPQTASPVIPEQILNLVPPMLKVSLATTTTVYLSVNATFGVSTCNVAGYIAARRRR